MRPATHYHVLAEGSVAKAASRLHVTPSAVSNALARLRVLFGDPLLTRKGRGIVPTPRALELAPVLARTLRDLQDTVRAGTFNPGIATRRFTIALSDVGQVVLPPGVSGRTARLTATFFQVGAGRARWMSTFYCPIFERALKISVRRSS